MRPGDVVVVMEENIPPTSWRLARVSKVHLGTALVRSVTLDVVMPGGGRHQIKRPVQKLCRLLDCSEHDVQPGQDVRDSHLEEDQSGAAEDNQEGHPSEEDQKEEAEDNQEGHPPEEDH